MLENSRIHFIPPKPPKREKRVAIYARVSTNDAEQLKSLAVQIEKARRSNVTQVENENQRKSKKYSSKK